MIYHRGNTNQRQREKERMQSRPGQARLGCPILLITTDDLIVVIVTVTVAGLTTFGLEVGVQSHRHFGPHFFFR